MTMKSLHHLYGLAELARQGQACFYPIPGHSGDALAMKSGDVPPLVQIDFGVTLVGTRTQLNAECTLWWRTWIHHVEADEQQRTL